MSRNDVNIYEKLFGQGRGLEIAILKIGLNISIIMVNEDICE